MYQKPEPIIPGPDESSSNGALSTFDPGVIHIVEIIIRHLEFLNKLNCITNVTLENIKEKLPKPIAHAAPHAPPEPSPTSIPGDSSPVHSISNLSETSRKNPSKNSSPKIANREVTNLTESRSSPPLSQQLEQPQLSQQFQQTLPIMQPQQTQQTHQTRFQQTQQSQTQQRPQPHQVQPLVETGISPTVTENTRRVLPFPPNSSLPADPPRPNEPPTGKKAETEFEKKEPIEPLPPYCISVVEALWDLNGDDEDDLNFKKGDIVEVLEKVNEDWWKGRIQGTNVVGIFPKVYTKEISIKPAVTNTVTSAITNTVTSPVSNTPETSTVINNITYNHQRQMSQTAHPIVNPQSQLQQQPQQFQQHQHQQNQHHQHQQNQQFQPNQQIQQPPPQQLQQQSQQLQQSQQFSQHQHQQNQHLPQNQQFPQQQRPQLQQTQAQSRASIYQNSQPQSLPQSQILPGQGQGYYHQSPQNYRPQPPNSQTTRPQSGQFPMQQQFQQSYQNVPQQHIPNNYIG